MKAVIGLLVAALAVAAFCPRAAHADEGMWTLDNLPYQALQERYGFTPSPAWQTLAMHASLRFAQGCSASFVSANGLVMTNHHCAESCLSQLSTSEHDYAANGFVAPSRDAELRCPDVELDQLEAITDVTAQVRAATQDTTGSARIQAERTVSSAIEKECVGGAGAQVRCDVISLYRGGRYALYRYLRYQDVRLVFAPEAAIADFGGDPDNFNFPRYDLDVTFLRVYSGGAPLASAYFPFEKAGPKAGEFVMVLGNPGATDRADTLSELMDYRDNILVPNTIYFSELRGFLWQYGNESEEHARQSHDDRYSIENSLKVYRGRLDALADPELARAKRQAEASLQYWIQSDAARAARYQDPWSAIAPLGPIDAQIVPRLMMLEWGRGFNSELFRLARALVRASAERNRPNAERLPEYRDARLPLLEQRTLADKPIHPEFEAAKLAWSLEKLRQTLGPDDPLVRQILGSDAPNVVAERLVRGSALADTAYRRRLWSEGEPALAASRDTMIALARLVDPESRRIRKEHEDRIDSVESRYDEQIARARFERDGTGDYPDATFSLRLSFGVVQGWDEAGVAVAPFTDFAGLYARATGSAPFALPPSWAQGKATLNLQTPYNLCSTNDIIGGNSGSPMIDREGHVVGVIFDGNRHSFGGDFFYDPRQNRAIAVDAAAIEESLRHVYRNTRLADELVTGHAAP